MKKTFTLIAFMLLLIAAKAQPVIENGVLTGWPNATGDIVIPDGVKEIRYWAFNRVPITSVTIPASVGTIDPNSFYDCKQLKSIIVDPNSLNFSSNGGVLFNKDQSELILYPAAKPEESYVIPHTVKTIKGDTFMDITMLKSVVISEGLLSIERYAFSSCNQLSKINIPASVTSIEEGAFAYNNALSEITVDNGSQNYISKNGVLLDKSKGILLVYPAAKNESTYSIPQEVNRIGDHAFNNCKLLTNLTIHNAVNYISSSSLYNCSLLSDISVDGGSMFYSSENGILFNQDKTTLLKYPQGKKDESYTIPSTVNTIEKNAFYYTQQKNIVIPNSVRTIKRSAFTSCPNLTSLKIPGSATNIEGSFIRSSYITNIKFENGITEFSLDEIWACYNLTTIDLSEVTSVTKFEITGYDYTAKTLQTFYLANEDIKTQFTNAGLKAIVGSPLQFTEFKHTLNGTSVNLSIKPISATGNVEVKEKGFVISQGYIPSWDNNNYKIPITGNALLPFEGAVNGLQPNLVYHARTYVMYDNITAYSEDITFVVQATGVVFPPTLNINEANIKVGSWISLTVQGDTQKIFDKAKWEVNGKALPENTSWWQIESTGIFILKATSADGKAIIEKRIEVK